MFDIISKLKTIKKDIASFKELDKSKLVSVSINIACLFTLLVIVTFARELFIRIDLPSLELLILGFVDLVVISLEVLLCMQLISYIASKTERVAVHIPYAIIISAIINSLIEIYKILRLIDVKTSITSLEVTTHTLTAVNVHITLICLLIAVYFGIGFYVYRKYLSKDQDAK